MPPIVKDAWEIDIMREAGRIVARGHQLLRSMVAPGVSTGELDAAYEKLVRDSGAFPTFKGYRGFTASICASINEEIVHGIPTAERILKEGDIISIDCGATYKGYVGDAAFTMGVGKISEKAQRIVDVTRESLEEAIRAVRPKGKLSDIGAAVQTYAEARGYGVVRDFVGHGIGQKMHEEPQVPNFVMHGHDYVLKPGIVLAIEPMLTEGRYETRHLDDGWTVVTEDGKLSAHWEHTVAVTADGHEVLTLP